MVKNGKEWIFDTGGFVLYLLKSAVLQLCVRAFWADVFRCLSFGEVVFLCF